jgi:short-subunit dehydrogenase
MIRDKQVILITGASSGLGEGMAREFALRGHDLALCARRMDKLQALAKALQQQHTGIRISVREVDVNDAQQVAQAFDAFSRTFGHIDRIVVNAGRGGAEALGTGDVSAALQVAQTNFVGAVAQCDAAMRLFRQQGCGHLVVLSSVSAVRGMPGGMATYAASKAGIATLAEGLRNEMKAAGLPIHVTTLMPGFIHTAINAHQPNKPFAVDVATGCRALVNAIESQADVAIAPYWPWRIVAAVLRWLPASRLPGAPAPLPFNR